MYEKVGVFKYYSLIFNSILCVSSLKLFSYSLTVIYANLEAYIIIYNLHISKNTLASYVHLFLTKKLSFTSLNHLK